MKYHNGPCHCALCKPAFEWGRFRIHSFAFPIDAVPEVVAAVAYRAIGGSPSESIRWYVFEMPDD